MDKIRINMSRSFQVFAKPVGALCNLACVYCYYLEKGGIPGVGVGVGESEGAAGAPPRMADEFLEFYIAQHISASPDEIIRFSWHGGEPTAFGLDGFRRIVALQRKYKPAGRMIANGLQTNGTLLDEDWGRFLAAEGFSIGLSLDGPRELHDSFRRTRDGKPTFNSMMRGYEILRRHGVATDILCVISAENVRFPLDVYGFFKCIEATYISFLPLVERLKRASIATLPDSDAAIALKSSPAAEGVSPEPLPAAGHVTPASSSAVDTPADTARATPDSVPAAAWGDFLCAVFDEWVENDIGRIKIQIFEEAARTAFGQEHSLCIFRPTCGDIPVVERNGDFYSCDHYVGAAHHLGNIRETPLLALLESPAQRAFGQAKLATLPRICLSCEVRAMCHGECPKNRLLLSPDGEPGWNYLCPGYRRFFNHARPFIEAVAAEWRRGGNPTS
jgi:uncharacterized protein